MHVEDVARVCHEANRGLCEAYGDHSQVPWDEAPDWQRESMVKGVEFALAHPDAGPADQHEAWRGHKVAEGWTYGDVKDASAKTHPCLVPYGLLPVEQRAKDYVIRAIVRTLAAPHVERGRGRQCVSD